MEEESFLKSATGRGQRVAFANAYPRGWPGPRGSRSIAGPPLAARGAGLLTRHEDELSIGDAVSTELTNAGWRRHLGFTHVPLVTAEVAGHNLARIANSHELTLFAHYSTDTAGHKQELGPARRALERVDALLGGVLAEASHDLSLLVVSDHGNVEDVRVGHTRNPVLGIATGAAREAVAEVTDLREIPEVVRRALLLE